MPDLLLGAVADDFTGGSDLAGMLTAAGAPALLVLKALQDGDLAALARRYPAVVIATKSRALVAADARAASLAAVRELRALGARQLYFKYCSTFDSTKDGNIGPVTEALLDELHTPFTVAVPALPANGRTQYLGHLFVGGELLSESPLRHHPVNPMTDANLVRHLQSQTALKVGLASHPAVRAGASALRARLAELRASGVAVALVDAVSDGDLDVIADATSDLPLLTGGSGLPARMAARWRLGGELGNAQPVAAPRGGAGPVLLLAGSCSAQTLAQIAAFNGSGGAAAAGAAIRLDVRALVLGDAAAEIDRASSGALVGLTGRAAVLVSSSAPAGNRDALVAEAGARGVPAAAVWHAVESALAELARRAYARGVRRFVVAGGETSGAVVAALDIAALEIGAMLAPGVPYCRAAGGDVELYLKSGNFGDVEFLSRAVATLQGGTSS